MRPLRRTVYRAEPALARTLFSRAPFVHLAGTDAEGKPVGRTLHGVIVGDRLCFHGAPAGEKLGCVGRDVVVWAEEVVAEIPSYFIDPVRACPATTLFQSAMAHGVLERIDDVDAKAAVLGLLMTRFQPEGGYRPIDARDDVYRAAVAGILVCGVDLANVQSKSKLGQNRSPDEVAVIVERLWERGAANDPRAVDLLLDHNPAALTKSWVARALPVPGLRLRCAPAAARADAAAALLVDAYWNAGVPAPALAAAHVGATAWVTVEDADGRLVASCRAIADGAKWAAVYDVIVAAPYRGRGVGRAVLRVLLDHPAVRRCRKVFLRTMDAQGVYEPLGFVVGAASRNAEMVLDRGDAWRERWARASSLS